MTKRLALFFYGISILAHGVNAQSFQKMGPLRYEGMAAEKVFVSHNTALLFAGEYLYYTVHCLNDKTKQPSNISTLAYVLLVSEEGEKIFEHKIVLRKSVGQGDFFVPTSVASGNYKLIAYTKWMRNGDPRLFFRSDITILNPYRADQSVFLKGEEESTDADPDQGRTPFEGDRRFVIETDKKIYPKRARVGLTIKNFRGPSGHGTYSLSVRRKSALGNEIDKIDPIRFIDSHQKKIEGRLPKYYGIEFLPEEMGERIIGKLVAKDSNTELENKMVTVSIPGDDFQLKAALTDDEGNFYVDVFESYTQPLAIVQVLENDRDAFEIELREDPPLVIDNLDFGSFQIDSTMKQAILERSIHNQVENGFYQIRPDTLLKRESHDPYWGGKIETYELDEFTRFPTLLETMAEILPYASIRRDGPDNFVFNVRLFENYEGPRQNALVFIDGTLIADYNEILKFDSKRIKRISVLRDKFELAGRPYRGMINIETLTQDYFEEVESDRRRKIDIVPPNPTKNYFRQRYLPEEQSFDMRIPDFNAQLLWEPRIDFSGNERTFEFYTSDVSGEFEIVLEGFSIFGRPVFVKGSLFVE